MNLKRKSYLHKRNSCIIERKKEVDVNLKIDPLYYDKRKIAYTIYLTSILAVIAHFFNVYLENETLKMYLVIVGIILLFIGIVRI